MRQLDTKIRQVVQGLAQLAKLGRSRRSDCLVNKGSAENLGWLPDSSVDFISDLSKRSV